LVELKLTKSGDAYRSPCPACNRGGERAIVITPAKAAYYCFAQKKGGDCISLVAHVKGIGQREAAEWIMEQLPQRGAPSPQSGNNSKGGARKGKSIATLRLITTDQLKPANDDAPEEAEPPARDPTDYTDLL
jgi:DNA primase